MTDRVMVDVETIGLEPGAVVLSIGAVRFSADGLGDEFYMSVDRESAEEAGLRVDEDTLEWWSDQPEEAQEVLDGGIGLASALEHFSKFYGTADEIWANSPAFDCEMLEAAYDAVGLVEPWEYYQERDYRTLKSLPPSISVEMAEVEHHALYDAKEQARLASKKLATYQGEFHD